ncbi:MAG: tetratricopeptide repeat protein [Bacteroidetes bacterium]|nr:tetratricopeptide repeat protein [Bacteroidota bacterium]
MRILLLALLLSTQMLTTAQPTAVQLRETATDFLRQGDISNAILVLSRAIQQEPRSMQLLTDLTYAYYLQRDFAKAIETMKPLLDREDAEERTYQVAGNVYRSIQEMTLCDKMFRRALKRFPQSGALYSEYGEVMLEQRKLEDAIGLWEKGIQADPGYQGNYYHAARYYLTGRDMLRGILYAEIYVNMDSYSARTPEIKALLLEGYKNFFVEVVEANRQPPTKKKSAFEESFRQALAKQLPLATLGLNVDRLVMIRTRFILDWFGGDNDPIPYRLLDHHRQLLQEGLFEAYNHWLFGASSDVMQYQNWVALHTTEMNEYSTFQQNRVFRMPTGQYYFSE